MGRRCPPPVCYSLQYASGGRRLSCRDGGCQAAGLDGRERPQGAQNNREVVRFSTPPRSSWATKFPRWRLPG
eukprot:766472-Heterocapsa_arctica.AAC.1